MNLRQTPKLAPHCFSCGLQNPNGDLLCLAHSNELELGRGAYFKTADILGAILCQRCHDLVDGRAGYMSKAEKHAMHRDAHMKTLAWWVKEGHV